VGNLEQNNKVSHGRTPTHYGGCEGLRHATDVERSSMTMALDEEWSKVDTSNNLSRIFATVQKGLTRMFLVLKKCRLTGAKQMLEYLTGLRPTFQDQKAHASTTESTQIPQKISFNVSG
jgi:hypothetical protein